MGNEQSLRPGIPRSAQGRSGIPLDPFVFFGLTVDSTKQDAKRAYYKKAQEYHPDAGGDPKIFSWIHQAYNQILQQLQEQQNHTDEHADRRKKYQMKKKKQEERAVADDALKHSYMENTVSPTPDNLKYTAPISDGPAPKFHADRFNDVFTQMHHVYPADRGYTIEELDKEMNRNDRAECQKTASKKLAIYRGPCALVSSSLISTVQELGSDVPEDFTSISGSLRYTDYKGAYTHYNNLENPGVDISRRPQSVDAYQTERANIRFTKSAHEEALEAACLAWDKEQEDDRVQRLLNQDQTATLQHDRAKKFYLHGRQ